MSEAITVEVEAKALGWVPEEEFRGDKSRWVSAEEFVNRGHTVLPILKKNNQELLGKLQGANEKLASLEAALAAQAQTTKDLLAFQAAEIKRRVESEVATVRAQLREARTAGDPVLIADLEEQLDVAKDKAKEVAAAPPPPSPSPPRPPEPEPWAKEFATENAEWFPKDKRRSALFAAAADELHATGLRGKDLLNAAKAEMEKVFAPAPGPGKAESGAGGGGGGSPSGGGKSYKDLPADAKAVCDSEAKKFVGDRKAFKTLAEWQKHYADTFFE